MSVEQSPVESLKGIDACPQAVEWAGQFKSLEALWYACPHAEWIIWTLEKINYQNETGLRMFAAACARRHWHLLSDPRSRHAVEIAEQFSSHRVGTRELHQARATAKSAAEDGSAKANWTAASAAAAMTACHTTRPTGYLAAQAASKYALAAAAWDTGTRTTTEEEDLWQADQLRGLLGADLPDMVALALSMLRNRRVLTQR